MSEFETAKVYSKGLSRLQKKLLRWIATKEGKFQSKRKPYEERLLERLEERSKNFGLGTFENYTPEKQFLDEIIENLGLGSPYGDTLAPPEIAKPRNRGIKWDAAAFLEHQPTSSNSSTLHNSLKALERRGLIIRGQSRGKRRRTSHVRLTETGIEAVREIAQGNNNY